MIYWCNQCETQSTSQTCHECGCRCILDKGYKKAEPFYHAHSFGIASAFADEVRRYSGTEFEPSDDQQP